MASTIDWLEESRKFDQVADIYHDNRPGYPQEILDRIIELSDFEDGDRILEVGSGTGLATKGFIGLGHPITCIEQGLNLIEEAKRTFEDLDEDAIEFVQSAFQDWQVSEGLFKMMFSAQAFHWIPKPQGYKQVAKSLVEGGSMHLFWNKYFNDDSEISNELSDLLKEFGVLHMMKNQDYQTYKERVVDGIGVTNAFGPVDVFDLEWQKNYTYDKFIRFLETTNGYISLEESDSHILRLKLMDLFSRNHYNITMTYKCVLFSTYKHGEGERK